MPRGGKAPRPVRLAKCDQACCHAVDAAMAAEGSSRIHNIRQIERGYERIHERLAALGAGIERIEGDGA